MSDAVATLAADPWHAHRSAGRRSYVRPLKTVGATEREGQGWGSAKVEVLENVRGRDGYVFHFPDQIRRPLHLPATKIHHPCVAWRHGRVSCSRSHPQAVVAEWHCGDRVQLGMRAPSVDAFSIVTTAVWPTIGCLNVPPVSVVLPSPSATSPASMTVATPPAACNHPRLASP